MPDIEAAVVGADVVVKEDSSADEDEHVHYAHRAPWLRAFVLGANDGLVSVPDTPFACGAFLPSCASCPALRSIAFSPSCADHSNRLQYLITPLDSFAPPGR